MTASVAEKQVLGSCLASPDLVDRIADLVLSDFTNSALSRIFVGIQGVAENGDAPSVSTVAAWLQSAGQLDDCGGQAGLESLVSDADVAAFEAHRRSVIDSARKRVVVARIREAAQSLANVPESEIPAAVAMIVAGVEADVAHRLGSKGVSSREATHQAVRDWVDRSKREELPGNPTNIPGLTRVLDGGFHEGELIILAARPSVGKTAEGLNLIDAMSIGHGIPTLVFSLEMSPKKNTGRLIVGQSDVGAKQWRHGTRDKSDMQSVIAAAGRVAESPITWGDARTLGGMVAEMTAWVNSPETQAALEAAKVKHADKNGDPAVFFPLVMIDHLHLVPNDSKKMNLTDWIAHVTGTLKRVAEKKLKIPLLALAQLNRANVNEGRAPKMSDLRGGGGAEENADVIILIDRDKDGERPDEATIILEKNREGDTGIFPAHWDGRRMRYTERVTDGRR